MPVEQVNANQSQSTLKITHKEIFIFGNQFDERTLDNTTAAGQITVTMGHLLFKNAATTVDLLAVADNIANIVGILSIENDVVLEDTDTLDINMATRGTIAEQNIVLTGGITLDTVIPATTITLRDKLNDLGFHLELGVDNTKFDNL